MVLSEIGTPPQNIKAMVRRMNDASAASQMALQTSAASSHLAHAHGQSSNYIPMNGQLAQDFLFSRPVDSAKHVGFLRLLVPCADCFCKVPF